MSTIGDTPHASLNYLYRNPDKALEILFRPLLEA